MTKLEIWTHPQNGNTQKTLGWDYSRNGYKRWVKIIGERNSSNLDDKVLQIKIKMSMSVQRDWR